MLRHVLLLAAIAACINAGDELCTQRGGTCGSRGSCSGSNKPFTLRGWCSGRLDICCFKPPASGNIKARGMISPDESCDDAGGKCASSCPGGPASGYKCAGGRKCCGISPRAKFHDFKSSLVSTVYVLRQGAEGLINAAAKGELDAGLMSHSGLLVRTVHDEFMVLEYGIPTKANKHISMGSDPNTGMFKKGDFSFNSFWDVMTGKTKISAVLTKRFDGMSESEGFHIAANNVIASPPFVLKSSQQAELDTGKMPNYIGGIRGRQGDTVEKKIWPSVTGYGFQPKGRYTVAQVEQMFRSCTARNGDGKSGKDKGYRLCIHNCHMQQECTRKKLGEDIDRHGKSFTTRKEEIDKKGGGSHLQYCLGQVGTFVKGTPKSAWNHVSDGLDNVIDWFH